MTTVGNVLTVVAGYTAIRVLIRGLRWLSARYDAWYFTRRSRKAAEMMAKTAGRREWPL